jgi:hypothetical protein
MTPAYLEAIRDGFLLARELDVRCGPVHLLAGVAEGDGPAAAALDPGDGRTLREIVSAAVASTPGFNGSDGPGSAPDSAPGPGSGPGFGGPDSGPGHVHMQAQAAAVSLAKSRGQQAAPAHLLIALLDQGTAPVLDALASAGLDPAAVRQAAASAIGAPGLPPVRLPALTPAGTLDRPPLPEAELDPRAWAALTWRQDHLPIARLRGRSDREALLNLERRQAWRVADRLALEDDQRYSLITRHASEVERRVDRARPDLPGSARTAAAAGARAKARAVALSHRRRRRARLPRALRNVTVGWGAWFSNRRVGLRDRWFRLRTAAAYRNAPQP